MLLKKIIKDIEFHTNENFDINNRRHFFLLNSSIERLNNLDIQKLSLIKSVLQNDFEANSLYNSNTHFITKKRL